KAGKSILTLIFETDGQYPQLVPIKVFGRLAEQAGDWKPGTVLAVSGRLGGRDWNGKVYGDNVATRVEVVNAGQGDGPPANDAPPAGSLIRVSAGDLKDPPRVLCRRMSAGGLCPTALIS
ncbi:MAG: DUF3127 domain-containing protein, partial [Polyangia bacterium]